jgi:hypothetical protein
MLLGLVPIFLFASVRSPILAWLPVGALFVVLTVAMVAFGELFTSARMYEYIGAFAPKGQEGLFLGYANLPVALGALIGGPVGAAIFNEVMCRGATRTFVYLNDLDPFANTIRLLQGKFLLDLDPTWNSIGWLILMAVGLASALGMALYNRWLEREVSRSGVVPPSA